jgi:hypothetical protein
MEAGGHYYTVYYVSLAVGFKQEIAFRHALLSQMSDQISWLDAAHMQITEAKGSVRNVPFLRYFAGSGREVDLDNNYTEIEAVARAATQYAQHGLTPNHLPDSQKQSAFQQKFTVDRLREEDPTSLKFGLLLHRLGDTFAHSSMRNPSVMYEIETTSFIGNVTEIFSSAGHAHDGHAPDFPHLRQATFLKYVEELFFVLFLKITNPQWRIHKRPNATTATFAQVKAVFETVFRNLATRQRQFGEVNNRLVCNRASCRQVPQKANNNEVARWFIAEMRQALHKISGVSIEAYAPENKKSKSLREFLADPDIRGSLRDANAQNIMEAYRGMSPGGPADVIPPKAKTLGERFWETEFGRGAANELRKLTTPPGLPY